MTKQIQPFAFEGLPNLPASAVSRSRAAARAVSALAGAGLRNVSARGLGKVVLEVERIDPAPWRGQQGGALPESAFSLIRDDNSWACLTVERFFALALVRAALGAPSPPVLRPLSPAERGVLGAIVASVLHASGSGRVRLSLERPRRPERDFVGVNLSIKTASLNGVGLLEVPVGWMPTVARSMPEESSFLLETEMRVEIGRTSLPAGAWAAAEVGDAVVFEGVSAAKDDTPWSCELGIGGHRASAQLSPDGNLRLQAAFVPGSEPRGTEVSNEKAGEGTGHSALLASAPVEVVAEIARVPMRGDEVMGLASGTVVALGERRRDLITLRVGGRAWARGELVNIDDQLGVRITELLRPR